MGGIIKANDIFAVANRSYRVLQTDGRQAVVIEMKTKKMNIFWADIDSIEHALEDYSATLECEEKSSVRYIHPDKLTGKSKQIYEQYLYTANAVRLRSSSLDWLTNSRERAAFLRECMEANGIGETTARTRLREYLQNGMTLRGLEAKYYNCGGKGKERTYRQGFRPGRKGVSAVVADDKIICIFDKILRRYQASGLRRSVESCYVEMIKDYFSDKQVVNGEVEYTLYPVAARPTRRQLNYYIHKKMNSADKYQEKNGYKAALNNIRPLYSDTIHSLEEATIGFYEIDEMETDYELVDSFDRNKVIGRGIMYMVIDIMSKQITGFSVGIDNNSWAGAEMALLNMAEDKVKYCREKGINITADEWPASLVLPKLITSDNGSEYCSDQFIAYARDNGIGISNTRSAMGSYKGNIESEFRQFNLKTNGLIPGLKIKGAYGRADEKSARLTIEEFEQLVLRYVLYHNKTPMNSYNANREIFESGIVPSPNNIWKYCMEHDSSCIKNVVDMDSYRLSLLCSGRASITREGITFTNLVYTCEDRKWLDYECSIAAIEGRKKIHIKYDKRCMDIIYYLTDDGVYKKATLNMEKTKNEKYLHCSYVKVVEINGKTARDKAGYEEERLANDVELQDAAREIVREAKKKHRGVNSSKNKSDNRKAVKEQLQQERNVVSGIGNSTKQPDAPSQSCTAAISFREQLRREDEKRYLEKLRKIGLQVEVPQ